MLLERFYVLSRRFENGTSCGSGYLEVVAASEFAALAIALGQPWPPGTQLGVARLPDVFKVSEWVAT